MQTDLIKLSLTLDPQFHPKEGEFAFDDLGLLGLYDVIVSGGALPLVMGCRKLSLSSVVGAAIFFQRDLLIHPGTLPLVLQVEYYEHVGRTRSIHMDEDLHRFLIGLEQYLHEGDFRASGERVTVATQWLRDYVLGGSLPNLGLPVPPAPHILDTGTNGFVLAKGAREAIPTLFRMGYLRGLVVKDGVEGRNEVTVFRKSDSVGFDLVQAKVLLDEMERMLGSNDSWCLTSDRVQSPEGGTGLLLVDVVKVLLHV